MGLERTHVIKSAGKEEFWEGQHGSGSKKSEEKRAGRADAQRTWARTTATPWAKSVPVSQTCPVWPEAYRAKSNHIRADIGTVCASSAVARRDVNGEDCPELYRAKSNRIRGDVGTVCTEHAGAYV
eukprot:3103324-Rhodomonas_salina.1